MDVGHHGPPGLRHAHRGPVGDVGAHTLGGGQPRPLPDEGAYHLRVQQLGDLVLGGYPSVANKQGPAHPEPPLPQPVGHHRENAPGVGGNGGGGQAVADDQLHVRMGRTALPDPLLVLLVKAPAQIRPGEKYVFVPAAGDHRQQAQALHQGRSDLLEHRVLGGRVVRPQGQHGPGLQPRPRPAHADAGGGPPHHPAQGVRILRVVQQGDGPAPGGAPVLHYRGRLHLRRSDGALRRGARQLL